MCFKGHHKEMKKRPTEWEEMLEVYVSDKGLISKILIAKKKKKPQMIGQVSRGSAGEYQGDEQAGVARLSWRVSGR